MFRVFQLLNLPCRDMTALISRSMDERLPFAERLAYKLHVFYCRACHRYMRQLRSVRQALRSRAEQLCEHDHEALPADVRERPGGRLRR